MNKDLEFYKSLSNLRDMGLIVIEQDENGEMTFGIPKEVKE